MANVFDYLDWRGDLSFSQVEFGEVDALVLSLLSYVDFEGILTDGASMTLLQAARQFVRKHREKSVYLGLLIPPETVSLLAKAAKSRRFGGLVLSGYENRIDEERQMQFCALRASMGKNKHAVIFRGTDDSLVGWKEDFNMSFLQPVPAQAEATRYLEQSAALLPGSFYVVGHSKGGNLAIYASTTCSPSYRDRIEAAYSLDGPGFTREWLESLDYQNMRSKFKSLIPQGAVVGLLLEYDENYEVIKSRENGLLQHNGFSWEILGGRFIHLDKVTEDSRRIDRGMKRILSEMNAEEREAFIESIYQAFASSGAKTLTELTADKIQLVKSFRQLSPASRATVRKCIRMFFSSEKKDEKKDGKKDEQREAPKEPS